ncbi:MAG: glycosyltransferase family 4 protein [Thaumarchaeota archaeon]|nr:glycosyltransferase family 4 protein [Nitrososphaerota archaeon]
MRICINTQTPLLRFKLDDKQILSKYPGISKPIEIEKLKRGEDYELTPGGVCAMIHPLMRYLMGDGTIEDASWVSLGPHSPPEVTVDGIRLYNIQLPDQTTSAYSKFKEALWNDFHGFDALKIRSSEYEAYRSYNALSAKNMLKISPTPDLFEIHDFQQLEVGRILGQSVPKILRWHIPFDIDILSQHVREFMLKNLDSYDTIIVSTKRDHENIKRAQYSGKTYQIYPFIDGTKYKIPSRKEINEFEEKFGLKGHIVLVLVARLDKIKGHDIALKALGLLRKQFPSIKLMIVGNGSFSGSKSGGLALPKATLWKKKLEAIIIEHNLRNSVIMTGYLPNKEVYCLYSRMDALILPSYIEGFGLTALEAWQFKKPVIVSRGAGVSEIVEDGLNGRTHKQGDYEDLAYQIGQVLRGGSPEKLGEAGFEKVKNFQVDKTSRILKIVFEDTISKHNG